MQSSGTLASAGDHVALRVSGDTARVERFLGAGGEGEVFEVSLSGHVSQRRYALKLYFLHRATQHQRAVLGDLIERGAPDARFLWPLDLAEHDGSRTFGYVMALRDEARFDGLIDYLRGDVTTTSSALFTAGYQLADSYLRLHAQGLCYRDISYGNVFFDKSNGDALICDNDNVAIEGDAESSVLGTPGFMAPEIVRREQLPSGNTDRHSLAVLLFYMLIRHNPLDGARSLTFPVLDAHAMEDLFGVHPVFIFDPDDDSNRPDPATQTNPGLLWPIYPRFMQNLFIQAFTSGLRDPVNGRVREIQWKTALVRLRDSIVYCSCGTQNLADLYLAGQDVPAVTCWRCHAPVTLPPRLRLRSDVVTLNHDRVLYPHHLLGATFDFSRVLAAVVQHPSRPDVWGLQNRSDDTWTAVLGSGEERPVGPGKSIGIAPELAKIRFPAVEGQLVL